MDSYIISLPIDSEPIGSTSVSETQQALPAVVLTVPATPAMSRLYLPPRVITPVPLSVEKRKKIQQIVDIAQYTIQKTIPGNPHTDFVPDRLSDDYSNVTYSHPHETAGFSGFNEMCVPFGYMPLSRIGQFVKDDPELWTYKTLERVMVFGDPKATLVVPGLYLGSVYHTYELPYLEYLGIKYIVSAIETKDLPDKLREFASVTTIGDTATMDAAATAESSIILRHLDIKDDGSNESTQKLRSVLNLIVDELRQQIENGITCFVHCQYGISRSSTIVAAYLIKYKHYTAENAVEYLRSYRPQVSPKMNFMRLLQEYEKSLSS